MTSVNSPSRSPSRATNRSQQSNPPGVLAISSAMLASAGQGQSGQSAAQGKRNKSSRQRPLDNASSTSHLDPSSPVASPDVALQDPATTAKTGAEDAASMTAASSDSPSKRTRSRRRAKPHQIASDADEGIDVSTVESPSASGKASRPRPGRGLSSINLSLTSPQQAYNDIDLTSPSSLTIDKSDADTLSKSAPASSYLDSIQQSKQRRGNSNLRKEDNNSSHHPNIRSSNSADEWEMPSARLITGNDSLTWQQQAALSRKSSQQGKKSTKSKTPADNNQFKKQTPAAAQRGTPTDASAPRSGLSNAMAAGAAADAEQEASSSGLTWQQAMLQRSAPATPASNIFEALEDGYSGARPASDHSRTRSSPVKNSRPVTRSQQQPQATLPPKSSTSVEEEMDLDKQLRDLVLSSVKPTKPPQPKSAKKAKPMSIQASTPAESAKINLFDASSAPSAVSASPAASKAIPMSANSVSPTKSALYAGPKFHNSPHAAQLPTPRLAALMNRNRESSPASQSPSSNEPIFA